MSFPTDDTITCPGCGRTLDLHDTLDEAPPIPQRCWPQRWAATDEGRRLYECPTCDEDLAPILDALPDYPWKQVAT